MIKCPYCGSEDFEIYDTVFGIDNNTIEQLASCDKCEKGFSIVYAIDHIEKVDN